MSDEPLFPRTLEGFKGASWMAEIEMGHFFHMASLKPSCRVLEIGTASGTTCAWVASKLPEAHFLCVDTFRFDPQLDPQRRENFRHNQQPNMSLFIGTVADCLWSNLDKKFDLIVVDADHSYENCLSDLRLSVPFLEVGGAFLVHDYGCHYWPGVQQAVHQFLNESNPAFRFICVQHSLAELRKEFE